MKLFITLILIMIFSLSLIAQPTTITYQGKLLDNSDMPVNELAVAFTFAIWDAESGGNKIWPPNNSAAAKSIDIVNGLYSVILGTGSGNDQAIEPSIFNGITPYLEVGVNATTLPRSRITSVPFSIISNNLSSSAWASPGAIGSATPSSGAFTNLTIGTGASTPNAAASVEIKTPLPIIFPSMTQAEINAITPVEGMVQFNEDAHKLQVYSMLTTNTSILNEIFMGTEVLDFAIGQSGTSPISGQIIAVELLLKDASSFFSPHAFILMDGQGDFYVPSYDSYTWFTFVLPNPIPVTAGGFWDISFIGPGVAERNFATNSNYSNGGGCCFLGADDLLFRIHIQPNPGSYGWQNLH
jgi:hypothetical protein